MFRTILFFFLLWLILLLSLVLLLPFLMPLSLFSSKHRLHYAAGVTRFWASTVLNSAGIKVHTRGLEHLPEHGSYIIVSNHQGNMDIPVFVRYIPHAISFVSKKEMKKVPLLSFWLKVLRCPVIDRSNSEEARATIRSHFSQKLENPLLIFPEGTRSRSMKMREFRTGGLEIVMNSGYPVVPVSISGSFRCWEQKTRVSAGIIYFRVHPPVQPAEMKDMSTQEFSSRLYSQIRGGLEETGR